jgi:hypothetical protein
LRLHSTKLPRRFPEVQKLLTESGEAITPGDPARPPDNPRSVLPDLRGIKRYSDSGFDDVSLAPDRSELNAELTELDDAALDAARTAFETLAARYHTAKQPSDDLHAACVALAALLRRAR